MNFDKYDKETLIELINLATDRINNGQPFDYDRQDREKGLASLKERFPDSLNRIHKLSEEGPTIRKVDILRKVKEDLKNSSMWIRYNYHYIHKDTGIIYRDGVMVKSKRINGVDRSEFIMQALEKYKDEITIEVASDGFGKVEHVNNKMRFKNNLGDLLYNSPYNLKRVPEDGSLLYSGVYNNRIIIKIFHDAKEIADYFDTSSNYVRQCIRGGMNFKGGMLEILSKDKILKYFPGLTKYGELEDMIEENNLEMEDRNWI